MPGDSIVQEQEWSRTEYKGEISPIGALVSRENVGEIVAELVRYGIEGITVGGFEGSDNMLVSLPAGLSDEVFTEKTGASVAPRQPSTQVMVEHRVGVGGLLSPDKTRAM